MNVMMGERTGSFAILVAASLCAATVLGCGSEAPPASVGGADGGAGSMAVASEVHDSGVAPDGGGGSGEDAARLGRCPTPRAPEGQLQSRADGPSVFGIVVGDDPGLFDPVGGSECGVAGFRICVLDTDTCTESDAAGQYVLGGLPEGEEVTISFVKPGHLPVLRLVQVGGVPINLRQTRSITLEGAMDLVADLGLAQDPDRGSIVATGLMAAEGLGSVVLADDVEITLQPDDIQPLYSRGIMEPHGLSVDTYDADLRATQLGGWGILFNVEPGDYTVRFERRVTHCNQPMPGGGFGLDEAGNIKIKVVAGYQTAGIVAFCQ